MIALLSGLAGIGAMPPAFQIGIAGIGALALLPLAITIVASIRANRRDRRRAAMMNRFWDSL